jgi:predicted dithiol-disulfide oxidoreductase (DUF899 family)
MDVVESKEAAIKNHKVVSREEWIAARKEFLKKEKEFTDLKDQLAADRRALPWVKVEKDYKFQGPNGELTLSDLFDGRSQLFLYHFMLGPGWDAGCPGCSFFADHVDGARRHFEHHDVKFVAVSRGTLPEIEKYKKRMGWTFDWVSSNGSDFNYDFGVSFDQEKARGTVEYNYETIESNEEEMPGQSIFYKDENGDIFHTYSTYARGGDILIGAYNFLEMMPKGRNEKEIMDWMRRHDEYDSVPEQGKHHH